MIDLGAAAGPGAAPARDVTDQTFAADVLDASNEVPVVVDFWAPWCGPCKTLGPMLEEAVARTNGKVRMVKVNIDENQVVAGQLRVQSIPAVFAFSGGRPVDGFMGALPKNEIDAFIKRLIDSAGAGFDEALEAAEEMLAQGAVADAAQTFAAILQEDAEEIRAMGGLIRATLAAGDIGQARAMLEQVPADKAGDAAITKAKAEIELAEQAEGAGETAELRARLDANPDDHQARYDLAVALSAAGRNDEAIDALLDLFRRDREWNDGAAKDQLFKIFDALGPKDPMALTGRRKLSSIIFA